MSWYRISTSGCQPPSALALAWDTVCQRLGVTSDFIVNQTLNGRTALGRMENSISSMYQLFMYPSLPQKESLPCNTQGNTVKCEKIRGSFQAGASHEQCHKDIWTSVSTAGNSVASWAVWAKNNLSWNRSHSALLCVSRYLLLLLYREQLRGRRPRNR